MQTKAERAAKAKAAKAAKAEAANNVAAHIAAQSSGIVNIAPLASNVAPAIIPAAAPASETPAPASLNPRAVAAALYTALNDSTSVPVKPLATFKAYRAALGVLRCGNVTPRNAAGIVIAIAASGQRFPLAGQPDVSFPRKFSFGGVQYCIENGCATDAVSAGAATYNAATETFTCNAAHAAKILGVLSAKSVTEFKPDAIAAAIAATFA